MAIWSEEQRVRLALEAQILQQKVPHFYWENRIEPGKTAIRGDFRSTSGNLYTLCIKLPTDYPYAMPAMYVTAPCPLYGYNGKKITSHGTSHSMHVWESDWSNYVKICHWKSNYWSASNSLHAVLMKGFLWIEALEAHRSTGNDINNYSLNY